jgi:hypothetical protein
MAAGRRARGKGHHGGFQDSLELRDAGLSVFKGPDQRITSTEKNGEVGTLIVKTLLNVPKQAYENDQHALPTSPFRQLSTTTWIWGRR